MSVIAILIGILALVFFYNLFRFNKVKKKAFRLKRPTPIAESKYKGVVIDIAFDIIQEPP